MRNPPVRSHLTVRRTRRTTYLCKQVSSTFYNRRLPNRTSPHEQSLIGGDSSSHLGQSTTRSIQRSKLWPPATKQKSLILVQQPALSSNEQIVPLTGNPFFMTILSKVSLHWNRLAVPEYIHKLLPRASISVFLSYGSKTWEVKYQGGKVFKRFSSGWSKFITDNSLGSGDGCVFELMDRENLHFKVQILRAMVPVGFAKGGSKDTPILVD